MVAVGRISSLLLSAGIVFSLASAATGQQQSPEGGGPGTSPTPTPALDEPTPSPTTASTTFTAAPIEERPPSSFALPRTAAPAPVSPTTTTGGQPTSDPTPSPTTPPKFVGTPAATGMGVTSAPAKDFGASEIMFDLPRTVAPTMPSYTGAPTSAPTSSAFGADAKHTATFAPTYDGSSWMSGSDQNLSGAPTSSPTSAEYMEAATSSPTALTGDGLAVRMLLKSMFGSKFQALSSAEVAQGGKEGEQSESDEAGGENSSSSAGRYTLPQVDGEGKAARSFYSKAARALRGRP